MDEIDHSLLGKAREQFSEPDATHERIVAIDDTVLFKVKIQRWRGAVWVDEPLPWLVAGGKREAGSPDDFYAALAADGRANRARYNAANKPALKTDTYVGHLLPDNDDRKRFALEAGARFVRHLEALVPDLVRRSLRDGHEHSADLTTFALGVQVRADHGHETYVAIRIAGSVSDNLTQVVLDIVPGCDPAGGIPKRGCPDACSARTSRHGPTSWTPRLRRSCLKWTERGSPQPRLAWPTRSCDDPRATGSGLFCAKPGV